MRETYDDIRAHFAGLVRAMNAMDVDGLVEGLAVPFVAFVLEDTLVLETRSDVLRATKLRMETVMAAPVTEASGHIVEITRENQDRLTVLFQWAFLTADGMVQHSDLIRYLISRPRDRATLLVETVEYLWISNRGVSDGVLHDLRGKEPGWKGIH